ncbi:MAG: hypothetical protein LBR34_06195 [Prevotella sp.]|jgi:hypothetical protein|nr:hypothetical protein [Prevotella sp.]
MKQYVALLILILVTNFAAASTPTNFLPMEDSYYLLREDVAFYGASISTTGKSYRPIITVDSRPRLYGDFIDSSDILICVMLFGIYFAFTHKRSQTRNIDL